VLMPTKVSLCKNLLGLCMGVNLGTLKKFVNVII